MTLDALGRPTRPTNHEVFEAWDDHIDSVTTVCPRVMEMSRAVIES